MLTDLEKRALELTKAGFGWGGDSTSQYKKKYKVVAPGLSKGGSDFKNNIIVENKLITNYCCSGSEKWSYGYISDYAKYCKEHNLPTFQVKRKSNTIAIVEADDMYMMNRIHSADLEDVRSIISTGTHCLMGHYLRNDMLATRHTNSAGCWSIFTLDSTSSITTVVEDLVNLYLYVTGIDILEYIKYRDEFKNYFTE